MSGIRTRAIEIVSVFEMEFRSEKDISLRLKDETNKIKKLFDLYPFRNGTPSQKRLLSL